MDSPQKGSALRRTARHCLKGRKAAAAVNLLQRGGALCPHQVRDQPGQPVGHRLGRVSERQRQHRWAWPARTVTRKRPHAKSRATLQRNDLHATADMGHGEAIGSARIMARMAARPMARGVPAGGQCGRGSFLWEPDSGPRLETALLQSSRASQACVEGSQVHCSVHVEGGTQARTGGITLRFRWSSIWARHTAETVAETRTRGCACSVGAHAQLPSTTEGHCAHGQCIARTAVQPAVRLHSAQQAAGSAASAAVFRALPVHLTSWPALHRSGGGAASPVAASKFGTDCAPAPMTVASAKVASTSMAAGSAIDQCACSTQLQ